MPPFDNQPVATKDPQRLEFPQKSPDGRRKTRGLNSSGEDISTQRDLQRFRKEDGGPTVGSHPLTRTS